MTFFSKPDYSTPEPFDGFCFEAEDFHLSNMRVVSGHKASGGKLAKVSNLHDPAEMRTTFDEPGGTFDLNISVQDETDGQSEITVFIDGVAVGTITLDGDNDGHGSDGGGFSTFTLEGIEVPEGAEIKLAITADGHEFVRVDKITLTPVDPELQPDALTVGEDDPATSINLLDNDIVPADATVVLVDDSAVPGGTLSVSEDGVLTFDPGQDFQDLNDGESVTFDVTYGIVVDTPLADPITIEAEDLHREHYSVKHGSQASGGKLLKTHSHEASATLRDFDGDTGTYDLSVFMQDESDGVSTIIVLVNGEEVDRFLLDRQSDGHGSNNGAFSEFVVTDLNLEEGDDLTIKGIRDGGELLRLDKLVLTQTDAVTLGDNLIVNGDFEDNANSSNDSVHFYEDIPGWSSPVDLIEVQEGDRQTGNARGNAVVELDANNNATIEQTVDITNPGTYRFSLDFAMRGHDASTNGLGVRVNGVEIATAFPTEMGFNDLSVDLDLEAGPAVIQIFGLGTSDSIGTVIDNVSLRQVVDGDDPILTTTATITVIGDTDNQPPVIFEPVVFAVPEGETRTLTAAQAFDPDGDDVIFFIAGGDDADKLTIDADGFLTLNEVPDFENPIDGPVDENGDLIDPDASDNVFDFILAATDGIETVTVNAQIDVIDVNENTDPFFTQFLNAAGIDEGIVDPEPFVEVPPGTSGLIGTAVAEDLEDIDLVFTLAGEDAGLFSIDASLGTIVAVDPLITRSFDNDFNYEFSVGVDDQNGGTASLDVVVSLQAIIG